MPPRIAPPQRDPMQHFLSLVHAAHPIDPSCFSPLLSDRPLSAPTWAFLSWPMNWGVDAALAGLQHVLGHPSGWRGFSRKKILAIAASDRIAKMSRRLAKEDVTEQEGRVLLEKMLWQHLQAQNVYQSKSEPINHVLHCLFEKKWYGHIMMMGRWVSDHRTQLNAEFLDVFVKSWATGWSNAARTKDAVASLAWFYNPQRPALINGSAYGFVFHDHDQTVDTLTPVLLRSSNQDLVNHALIQALFSCRSKHTPDVLSVLRRMDQHQASTVLDGCLEEAKRQREVAGRRYSSINTDCAAALMGALSATDQRRALGDSMFTKLDVTSAIREKLMLQKRLATQERRRSQKAQVSNNSSLPAPVSSARRPRM